MPSYVMLLRWTQKGVENAKESPSRLAHAREAFRAAGGQLKDFYLTMGAYDMVAICEAPDDAAYARTVLALAAGGTIRTETLRAFPESEYRDIVGSLP